MPGDPLVLATIDFLANGRDCYPLADIEFTSLGVTYQQALADYISEDLGGNHGGRLSGGRRGPHHRRGDRVRARAKPMPETVTVTVRRGDSLWRLARIQGTGTRWREIFDLNRGRPQVDGRPLAD